MAAASEGGDGAEAEAAPSGDERAGEDVGDGAVAAPVEAGAVGDAAAPVEAGAADGKGSVQFPWKMPSGPYTFAAALEADRVVVTAALAGR